MSQLGPTPPAGPRPKAGAKAKARGRKVVGLGDAPEEDQGQAPKPKPGSKAAEPSGDVFVADANLVRAGQTLTDALSEATDSIRDKINACYPGWTPQLDTLAEVHQRQQRAKDKEMRGDADKNDAKRRSSWGLHAEEIRGKTRSPNKGTRTPEKGSASSSSNLVSDKDKHLKALLQHAGEPGSFFWSPAIMQEDIADHLDSLHTDELEELLTKQVGHLEGVMKHNSGLQIWLGNEEKDAEDMHAAADLMIEGLQSKIDKSGKKSAERLQAAQASGKKMVAAINSALKARENIRKILLEDANIVITDEKKQMLEERRKQGQELSYTMIEVKKQEEEDGSGLKESPQVTELKDKIAKKSKRHGKLKSEHEKITVKLRALEQALNYLANRYENSAKGEGTQIDETTLELIEEAKGIAREQVLAPLLRQLEVDHDLHSVREKELPQELLDERDSLEKQIAEVDAQIASVEKIEQDEDSEQKRLSQKIEGADENEQLLSELTTIRRRSSSATSVHVMPPMAGPMPDFDLDQVQKIQNSLKKSAREYHKELAKLPDFMPKYLAIIGNALKSAEEISQQRAAFISHVKNLKEPFMKDLRAGGAKDPGDDEEGVKQAEKALMEKVSKEWDEEVQRLCRGHLALDKRCGFFKQIIADVQDELEKVQVAVDKSRWAISDKIASLDSAKQAGVGGAGHAEASKPDTPASSEQTAKAGRALLGAFRNAKQKKIMQKENPDAGSKEGEAPSAPAGIATGGSLFRLVRQQVGQAARRTSAGMNFLMEDDEDEGELASERDMKAFLAFTEPDDMYFNKAVLALRLQDQKVLQKYIQEGDQAEAEVIAEEQRAAAESVRITAASLAAHTLATQAATMCELASKAADSLALHASSALAGNALATHSDNSLAAKSLAEHATNSLAASSLAAHAGLAGAENPAEDDLPRAKQTDEDEDDEEGDRKSEKSSFSEVSLDSPIESTNKPQRSSAKSKIRKVQKALTLLPATSRLRRGTKFLAQGSGEASGSASEANTPRGTPLGGESLFPPLEPLKEGKRADPKNKRPAALNTSRAAPENEGMRSEPSTPRRASSLRSIAGGLPSRSAPSSPARPRPALLNTKSASDLGRCSPSSPRASGASEGSQPATPSIKALKKARSPSADSGSSKEFRSGSPEKSKSASPQLQSSPQPEKLGADADPVDQAPQAAADAEGPGDSENHQDTAGGQKDVAPPEDMQADQPSDEDADEDEDLDEFKDVSDGLRGILQLDQTSRRLERKIEKLSDRLTAMRKDLTGAGKEVFPLDLDRLKLLEGDEKTHQLARESVRDLKLNWQEILRRRKAAGKGYHADTHLLQADQEHKARTTTWSRPKTEEEAFQDTYNLLLGEIEKKKAGQDSS
eukprot:TRINITY_DN15928_c0_g1_i1.p1 TRINITY_DN15928_c0_g1~~TRINITY_DN15928_c0_g1_i1.p1  ORF type:complete len:1376 (-),score=381.59 TRINITY_DN15928_c0_g1_i1:232-4359(-)